MKITNKHRLPKPVVELVSKPFYHTPGRMGVTSLISPPGMYQLRIRHDDEIVEDAAERISLIHGIIGHKILQEAAEGDPSLLGEKKYTIEMDGRTIVCIGDLLELDLDKLSDYKFTSVWHVIGGTPEDWIAQLNCNGYIYRKNGHEVNKLEVFAILDHWSKPKALQGGNYPKRDSKKFIIPMWNDQEIEDYIHNRIAAHKAAEKLPDAELPICTSEERWQKTTTYAVMKEGRTTALRVVNSNAEALSYIEWANKQFAAKNPTKKLPVLTITIRPGSEIRCEEGKWDGHHFCSVRKWCNFYQELKRKKENGKK